VRRAELLTPLDLGTSVGRPDCGPGFAIDRQHKERRMTLSGLIGSLTRRPAPPVPVSARRVSTLPDAGRLAQSSTLEFVPAKDSEHVLGAQRDVRERIADVLPGVVFDEDGKGAFTRTGYVVAFDTGHEDYVRVVRVEITGGSAAMPPLQRLVAKTGWRLMPAAARD
jgi:hypothetical protein